MMERLPLFSVFLEIFLETFPACSEMEQVGRLISEKALVKDYACHLYPQRDDYWWVTVGLQRSYQE